MSLDDLKWEVEKRWDKFVASKTQTHIAAIFVGIAIGMGLML